MLSSKLCFSSVFRLSFTLMLFLLLKPIFSQSYQHSFEHFTIDDGLSNNTVMCIMQDKHGFMWFATNNGLNRYDGYQTTRYIKNQNDTNSISQSVTISMHQDTKNRIWIGTLRGGLNRYDNKREIFRHYGDAKNTTDRCFCNVYAIVEDENQHLYIATSTGLFIYNEDKDAFVKKEFNGQYSFVNSAGIRSLNYGPSGNLWIGTFNFGVLKYDIKNDRISKCYSHENGTLKSNAVYVSLEDSFGNLWVGTKNGGLSKIDLKNDKSIHFNEYLPKKYGASFVRSLVIDRDNNMWIATDGDGLIKYNIQTKKVAQFKYQPAISESINADAIKHLYLSKNNILWLGLVNGGVDRVDLKQVVFKHLKSNYLEKESLVNKMVNGIVQDIDKNYWVATEGGVTKISYDLKNYDHFTETTKPVSINNNAVTAIATGNDNNIYIGSYRGGLNIYNPRLNNIKYLTASPENKNSLSNNFVKYIYRDADNILWISTLGGGLDRYDTNTETFLNYSFNNATGNTVSNDYVNCAISTDKYIWVATTGEGLDCINKKTHVRLNYSHIEDDSTTISNNVLTTLHVDADSVLWVGTEDGLNKFNEKEKSFTRFSTTNGLANNSIRGILSDANSIWVSTGYGLSRINKQNFIIRNFYKSDGLQSNEFIQNSCLKDADGNLLFGGINGLSVFNPSDIKDNIIEVTPVFTDLYIYNKRVNINEKFDGIVVLDEAIIYKNKITLSYRQKVFSLFFSAMSYQHANRIKFRYRLQESNETWMELDQRNSVTFHDLSPGDHSLLVQASNIDGMWPENQSKMIIHIIPPFWKQMWFKFMLLLIIVLISVAFYAIKTNNIHKQQAILKSMVEERTMELQVSNSLLNEKQAELQIQHEELNTHKEFLKHQNKELEYHKNNLECIVARRTNDLLKAKEEAIQADRLKTAFLANMSHEIRTPMNAILGFIEVLDMPDCTEEEQNLYKDLINSSGQTLLMLINDIIDIAKIESGELKINKEVVELKPLFEELFSIFTQKISKNDLNVEIELNNIEPLSIQTDYYRLKQILVNLLDNALKFTHTGVIKFGYQKNNNVVNILVKDTGIGISKSDQRVIFDRFRKLDSPQNRVFRGTGLGLSISKQLIELLGGNIRLESQEKKGTTFFITLSI